MQIGEIEAKPGSSAFGLLRFSETPSGAPLGVPIHIVHGKKDGPVLLVDAAMHGQEVTGTLAIKRLLRSLSPASLVGTLICVPSLCTPAFDAGTRINISEYEPKNMDHVFPGLERGNLAEMAAYFYYHQVVKRADVLLNFHTGGFYLGPLNCTILPPSTTPDIDREVEALARVIGLDQIWYTLGGPPEYGGSLIEAAARGGVPAVQVEIGSHTAWYDHGEEFIAKAVRAIENVMKHLGMVDGRPQVPDRYLYTKGPLVPLFARHGGIWEPLARMGDRLRAGQSIGRTVSPLSDEELERIVAPFAGIVLEVRPWPVAFPGGLLGHFADGEFR